MDGWMYKYRMLDISALAQASSVHVRLIWKLNPGLPLTDTQGGRYQLLFTFLLFLFTMYGLQLNNLRPNHFPNPLWSGQTRLMSLSYRIQQITSDQRTAKAVSTSTATNGNTNIQQSIHTYVYWGDFFTWINVLVMFSTETMRAHLPMWVRCDDVASGGWSLPSPSPFYCTKPSWTQVHRQRNMRHKWENERVGEQASKQAQNKTFFQRETHYLMKGYVIYVPETSVVRPTIWTSSNNSCALLSGSRSRQYPIVDRHQR